MVIKLFQMPIGNGHWESNFFKGYFSPIVVEKTFCLFMAMLYKDTTWHKAVLYMAKRAKDKAISI